MDRIGQVRSTRPLSPQRRSIVEALYQHLEGRAGAGRWFFPAVGIGSAVYLHLVGWLSGSIQQASIEPAVLILAFDGLYALWAVALLRNVTRRAFDSFSSVLQLSEPELAERRRGLLEFPRGRLAPLVALGSLLALAAGAANVHELERAGWSEPAAAPLIVALVFLNYATFPVCAYYSFQVLRGVQRLHREVTSIDLWATRSLFAFSRLTMWVGLAWAFNQYVVLTIRSWTSVGAIDLGVAILALGVGAACFVLPLVGLHGRLVEEQATLLTEVDRRYELVGTELLGRIDGRHYGGGAELHETLAALGAIRATVLRLPTWPWPPELAQGFVSALVLPLIALTIAEVAAQAIGG